MMSQKSYRPVLLALTIMLLGLFMLCAHKQAIETPGEDLTGGDEEFRQELLEMLDLANDGEDTAMFAATNQPETSNAVMLNDGQMTSDVQAEDELSEDEAALMALLAGLDGDAAETEMTFEATPAQAVTPKPVAKKSKSTGAYAYNELMSEVERLEMILEQRSMQADSLRRIIDNRAARIARLENDLVGASATPLYAAVESTDAPVAAPVIVSTRTAKSYQPVQTSSGPFSQKYNEGRRQFESYNYQGCIETMTALLQEDPNHLLADNAQYWIGESYYGLKQYQKAILEFQKVFAFDKTDKYDDAQLMIGLSYVRLDQSDMARSTFGEFLDTYAGSEYTGIAKRYYYNI